MSTQTTQPDNMSTKPGVKHVYKYFVDKNNHTLKSFGFVYKENID